MKTINWKIFFILLGSSLLSVVLVFPYILSVQGELLERLGQPVELIFAAQLIQSLVFFSVAIFLGLYFARRINFRLPLLEAITNKGDYKQILNEMAGKSIFSGIAAAIAIYVLDPLFGLLGATITTHTNYAPAWQKILASFYGGITEEILIRLFLMTLFIWITMKIFRRTEPPTAGIIISILLAAVIFGLGHLPITASLVDLNALIVARAIVLNGVGGVIFGWLFWKKGFESAVIAHFTTDIFLLTILPYLFN
jgi:hypothetical protein